jgi:hypothetical protein
LQVSSCAYHLFDFNNALLEGQDAAQTSALAAVSIEAARARKEPKISRRETAMQATEDCEPQEPAASARF